MLRITREFDSYNDRRYSKPWIAVVTAWPVGANPTLQFGEYLGKSGCAGEVEIEAVPGAVIRWGQKDLRRSSNTESRWGVVNADGTVTEVTQAGARKAFTAFANPPAPAEEPEPAETPEPITTYTRRWVYIVQDTENGRIAQVYGNRGDAEAFVNSVTRHHGNEVSKLIINEFDVEFANTDGGK